MNLTPYPNLLLQMPPPNHVVHTAKKQQKWLIQQSQSTEKIILSEGEADPQNAVPMFTCCKTATIAHKLSQAKVELQSTIHSRPLDFDFIDLGEGQVSSRDRVSKTINNQSFKGSLCTSWGGGTAPRRKETDDLLQIKCLYPSVTLGEGPLCGQPISSSPFWKRWMGWQDPSHPSPKTNACKFLCLFRVGSVLVCWFALLCYKVGSDTFPSL